MDELINYNGYEEFKQAVNRVLNRTVEDFVLTGYLLKQARDTDILRGSGYNNVNEFAWGEYKLDASQVSRYIKINDKFSEGGYSPKLQEQYQGFGYGKGYPQYAGSKFRSLDEGIILEKFLRNRG